MQNLWKQFDNKHTIFNNQRAPSYLDKYFPDEPTRGILNMDTFKTISQIGFYVAGIAFFVGF